MNKKQLITIVASILFYYQNDKIIVEPFVYHYKYKNSKKKHYNILYNSAILF